MVRANARMVNGDRAKMTERTQVEADILKFVASRCPNYPGLALNTDLLEQGLLDSLLLIDVIFQIEEKYGIKLGGEHVGPTHFRSPAAIVDLVMSQVASAQA
jgi:acyl carrier protein